MNKTLQSAKNNKKDEFYTLKEDIENELIHYREMFKGKSIYCCCDNPYKSNFYNVLKNNFSFFGLKELIATCFIKDGNGLYARYDGTHETIDYLETDGDFCSSELEPLFKQCDIVVTNPPFSLFRTFIDLLMGMNKKFLIIGSNNALSTKDIFKYVKDKKLWLGRTVNKSMKFIVPDGYEYNEKLSTDTQHIGIVNGISWFTNLPIDKTKSIVDLYKSYTQEEFPTYDEYNAINVNKVSDIPFDYDGLIGVPITIIGLISKDGNICFRHNGEFITFEIYGIDRYVEDNKNYGKRFTINGKEIYARVLIKKIK